MLGDLFFSVLSSQDRMINLERYGVFLYENCCYSYENLHQFSTLMYDATDKARIVCKRYTFSTYSKSQLW